MEAIGLHVCAKFWDDWSKRSCDIATITSVCNGLTAKLTVAWDSIHGVYCYDKIKSSLRRQCMSYRDIETYDISFEPAICVLSYCSMSSQLYCVFNGETAPSGGRPAEQIWVKYVVFHSRNSVLFNMV